jgi:anti-anti-sigma factor
MTAHDIAPSAGTFEAANNSAPPMCAFVYQATPPASVLNVFGEIDLSNVSEFQAAIDRLEVGEDRRTIVNLAGCTYIDSSGLRALCKAYLACGRRMRIVVPAKGPLRRIFTVTGLTTQLEVAPTLEHALS